MAKAFFLCYGGTDRYGNKFTPYKTVANTADEAIATINTWKTYGKSHTAAEWEQIKVNEMTEKKIRELFTNGFARPFDGREVNYISLRTTGCGCWDITIRPALADTLEEHERIYNEQRESAKRERMRQSEIAKQQRIDELNEQRRGWYHVELDIRMYVFACRGNDYHEETTYTCSLVADSGMDAYNKTVKWLQDHPEELAVRGNQTALEMWAEPTSNGFGFSFLGVKTDDGYSVEKWQEWKDKGDI